MNRTTGIDVGVVVLALLLMGAAFVAGTLLATKPIQAEQPIVISDGNSQSIQMKLDMERAKELPTQPMDLSGIVVRRADNSLFLGTGNITPRQVLNPDLSVKIEKTFDGPVVEIVVNHATTIYKDVTAKQYQVSPPIGRVQQLIEPGSIDDIPENRTVIVWGERRGERIIATVLLYLGF
ncbi:MAG: hypothetical protein HZB51_10755 [Chloroflexi bacterium]|nr:hypothetical protein [Chloroflexota bacterium]